MNRWIFAGIGEFIGVIIFTTTDDFYGANNIADVAEMIGFGIPFALIGFLVGIAFEKFAKKD